MNRRRRKESVARKPCERMASHMSEEECGTPPPAFRSRSNITQNLAKSHSKTRKRTIDVQRLTVEMPLCSQDFEHAIAACIAYW